MSCDDGSLSHDDVYIPDPVEVTDEDDGYSPEPTTDAVLRIMPDKRHVRSGGWRPYTAVHNVTALWTTFMATTDSVSTSTVEK